MKALAMKWQLLFSITFLMVVVYWLLFSQMAEVVAAKVPIVSKAGQERIILTLELADTPIKQQQGLTPLKSMGYSYGMLYVFDSPAKRYLRTKDMRFNTDIFFVDKDNRIATITKQAQPCYSVVCPLYDSIYDVKYIIQATGGLAESEGIVVGDVADIRL